MTDKECNVLIGQKIRMYRKIRGYTLKQFSEIIHCSLSTLAKYESGEILISASMLMRIAENLQVLTSQLLPDKSFAPDPIISRDYQNFYRTNDKFYLYQQSSIYKGITEDGVIVHCMKVLRSEHENPEKDKVVFYATLIDPVNNDECSYYTYKGYIHYYDYLVIIELENVYNKADIASIYSSVPFSSSNETTGLYIGVPQKYRTPAVGRVLISSSLKAADETLLRKLNMSDKDSISELKRTNIIIL